MNSNLSKVPLTSLVSEICNRLKTLHPDDIATNSATQDAYFGLFNLVDSGAPQYASDVLELFNDFLINNRTYIVRCNTAKAALRLYDKICNDIIQKSSAKSDEQKSDEQLCIFCRFCNIITQRLYGKPCLLFHRKNNPCCHLASGERIVLLPSFVLFWNIEMAPLSPTNLAMICVWLVRIDINEI